MLSRTRVIVALLAAFLALVIAAGCGSSESADAPAAPSNDGAVASPEPSADQSDAASSDPAPGDAPAKLRATVRRLAATMMADIEAAEQRGDVVDGIPVGSSSNPHDYVGISPAFTKLVALGKDALPALAAEIRASRHDGLREYLLAAAGAQIDGEVPGAGGQQSWETGKEWAKQFPAGQ